jgi:hypothetical protein
MRSGTLPKHRRRAAFTQTWIPDSLLGFNLSPVENKQTVPVPLPSVYPIASLEERNSYDVDAENAPYGANWKGKLPGPGLTDGKSICNP